MQHKAKVFIAEQIASYMSAWTDTTSDKTALQIVEGDEIEFVKEAFAHNSHPHNSFSTGQVSLLEQELHSLLANLVLVPSKHESQEFMSPIVTVPKNDGKV